MLKKEGGLLPDELYHIYNIGIDGRIIFQDKCDYRHFIKLLYLTNTKDKLIYRNIHTDFLTPRIGARFVRIGAYCLMPDRFHLILTSVSDRGISKFMQKLLTAYSMYYNIKYERRGTLFQGSFKAKHLNCNKQLKDTYLEFALNPISLIEKNGLTKGIKNKEEVLDHINNYEFFSYKDILDENRESNKILDRLYFPGYFYDKKKVKEEVQKCINLLAEKTQEREKPNSQEVQSKKEEKTTKKTLAPA